MTDAKTLICSGRASRGAGVALTQVAGSSCNPNFSWWQSVRDPVESASGLDIGVDIRYNKLNTGIWRFATLAAMGARSPGV